MCGVKGRRFIVLFKLHSICWLMKMAVWSLAFQQSVFQQCHSEKHLSRDLPIRWRRKPDGVEITSLSYYVYLDRYTPQAAATPGLQSYSWVACWHCGFAVKRYALNLLICLFWEPILSWYKYPVIQITVNCVAKRLTFKKVCYTVRKCCWAQAMMQIDW